MTERNGPTDSYTTERVQRIRPSQRMKRAETNVYAAPPRAEVSAQARFAKAAREIPAVRMDRVDALREKLNAAGYDLDAEFKAAMQILIDEAL
ncbi:MAG: flagellar biosynthesis anti-sigma factor FlgM [Planctomycetes bacterium]|nr:flagellar biosynthesis anti-sigma factor FlgM [Planctomycetota bacterium]MCW8136366.1 flagellar biosynthesis anti-sigma factor FlgM [Planctomycetota bacterium]